MVVDFFGRGPFLVLVFFDLDFFFDLVSFGSAFFWTWTFLNLKTHGNPHGQIYGKIHGKLFSVYS